MYYAKHSKRALLKFGGLWSIHLLTACGAVLGLFALEAAFSGKEHFQRAFILLAFQIAIDAIDGTLARRFRVKDSIPQFDGALLDNLVDYLTYVIVPAAMIISGDFLPPGTAVWIASLIAIASGYQFCHQEAKTDDHFFRGFPSYWSIVVFYFWVFNTPVFFNLIVLVICLILVFVPIAFLYPSRLDNVSDSRVVRISLLALTLLWGLASLYLLLMYPERPMLAQLLCWAYPTIYVCMSLRCTYFRAEAGTKKLPD